MDIQAGLDKYRSGYSDIIIRVYKFNTGPYLQDLVSICGRPVKSAYLAILKRSRRDKTRRKRVAAEGRCMHCSMSNFPAQDVSNNG